MKFILDNSNPEIRIEDYKDDIEKAGLNISYEKREGKDYNGNNTHHDALPCIEINTLEELMNLKNSLKNKDEDKYGEDLDIIVLSSYCNWGLDIKVNAPTIFIYDDYIE